MTTELIETKSYQSLVKDLSDLLTKGQQAALNAVNEIRVSTYWQMGKRMTEMKELADPAQATGLTAKLSEDLKLDQTLLYRIIQFYRTWPDAVPKVEEAGQLIWAH